MFVSGTAAVLTLPYKPYASANSGPHRLVLQCPDDLINDREVPLNIQHDSRGFVGYARLWRENCGIKFEVELNGETGDIIASGIREMKLNGASIGCQGTTTYDWNRKWSVMNVSEITDVALCGWASHPYCLNLRISDRSCRPAKPAERFQAKRKKLGFKNSLLRKPMAMAAAEALAAAAASGQGCEVYGRVLSAGACQSLMTQTAVGGISNIY